VISSSLSPLGTVSCFDPYPSERWTKTGINVIRCALDPEPTMPDTVIA